MGGGLEKWEHEPYDLTYYVFRHLREQDYRAAFFDRLHRIEAAQLIHIAVSDEPQRLNAERVALIQEAGPLGNQVDADEVARARAMIEELERTGAMNRPPVRVS
jgi:hypothetical protein